MSQRIDPTEDRFRRMGLMHDLRRLDNSSRDHYGYVGYGSDSPEEQEGNGLVGDLVKALCTASRDHCMLLARALRPYLLAIHEEEKGGRRG